MPDNNKKVELLVQDGVFYEDQDATTQTTIAKYFTPRQFKNNFLKKLDHTGPFRGSLELAKKLKRKFTYTNALMWAPVFRETLVDPDYIFLDARAILSRGITDRTFIRPVSGNKEFSGYVFTQETFKNEIEYMKSKNISDTIICMVAPEHFIKAEWRCVFVNNAYAGGSQYMHNGAIYTSPNVPSKVIKFAKELAQSDYFQNIFEFVIDIGMVNNQLKLIEINAFETASFYKADLESIYSKWAKSLIQT